MAVVILTPNLAGRDGVSRLARLVTHVLGEVTVLALHEPATLTAFDHAEVRSADGRRTRFAGAAMRCAASCDSRTTVIVIHLHLAPAALPLTARGASVTTLLCGVEAWKPLTWMQRAALVRSDRLIAISQFTSDRFRAANPHFAGRAIDICHPGIDPLPLSGRAGDAAPSALVVGRMSVDERYKGHDALLEIWSDVGAAVPGAVLRIVGDGDDRARLERKAAALNIASGVVFVGGVDDEALGREYERCTAFVMPSRDEGFGFVFVEAMRAARACIGGHGAASEIIADEETGLLVDAEDRAQLLKAMVRILGDRAGAAAMGARGRTRFLQQFTEDHFRDRLTALLPLGRAAVPTRHMS